MKGTGNRGGVTRRAVLRGVALSPVLALSMRSAGASVLKAPRGAALRASPMPLESVRLAASPFLAAIESNRKYLLELEPDRLLHNFRLNAGLTPKGEIYGGWESESLGGHTLGHYLSACSLMYAQVGETQCERRVEYIVEELASCQAASGDGYVSGFTRRNGDKVENGKTIFAELVRGDIRSAPFNLNGVWSPLYTVHKLLAGLLDAERYCANSEARNVAMGMCGYLDRVFARLTDAEVQQVLDTEFGGITESLAELYARTGDERWLKLAERLYHHRILDPLAAGRDELDGIHSNTQIPKLIAEARLYELTGTRMHAATAEFFWRTVTSGRTYVIGGNSDRENFERPLAKFVTEQTCETCNTHNMLKLTRHLYAWRPDASYFDYYERAHFNHILAHHDPGSGMFTYMMPLLSGARREFSTRTNDFWCCVGTGLESHSKHGDSIYWQSAGQLFVNLYIPSGLRWAEQGARLALRTDYPLSEEITLEIAELAAPRDFAVALRIPGWCSDASVSVNGKPASAMRMDGYAVLRRRWKAGDAVQLTLPMRLRTEPMRDDPDLVAFLYGPLVLAADLGPADVAFSGPAPGIVGEDLVAAMRPIAGSPAEFDMAESGRPRNLRLKPFFRQYDRRTAVYFRHYTEAQWGAEERSFAAEQGRIGELDARAVDVLYLGKADGEQAHGLTGLSETLLYRGRDSRLARKGGWFEFRMKCARGPMTLQATYRGDERNRRFRILVDGVAIATQRLDGERGERFFDQDYPIPTALSEGKQAVIVRFEADRDFATGPVYACRMLANADLSATSA